MVFWIAILAGVLFIWLAVRMGFYETWVLLFNIVVSVYLAIFLAPILVELAPVTGNAASYSMAISMVVLAGGCFASLQGLSYVFLTGQFSIPFPRIFDVLLSGLLGFLAGFLVLSFAALVLTTTPLTEYKIVNSLGLSRQSQKANLSCIAWCCDTIHSFARFEAGALATQAAVQRLLEASDRLSQHARDAAGAHEPSAENPSQTPPPEPRKDETTKPRTGRRSIPTDAFTE
ncbi:MAG: hypothetical protein A2Y76_06295 [Planctomycetes bacterium RBG_13_60_9]|nr:MAG: hypothetical protein A2Y76_06295 [Planctomycetes bacterium RBG_13_60_9]